MSRTKSVLIAFGLLFALALPAAAARPASEREPASQSFALSWLWEGIAQLWGAIEGSGTGDAVGYTDDGQPACDPAGCPEVDRGDTTDGRGAWDPNG
jgi:hypothetical protein